MIKTQKHKIIILLTIIALFTGCGNGEQEGKYRVINKNIYTQGYGIACRNGDENLRDTLTGAIKVLAADGTVNKYINQYISGKTFEIDGDQNALDEMEVSPRKLIVGFKDDKAPLAYMDSNNNPAGFDVDMAKAACGLLGWEIEFRVMEFDEVAELESGNVDCVWGGFTLTQKIKKSLTCTDEYLTYNQVLVSLTSSSFKSVGSLKGEKIAVIDDYGAKVVTELAEPVLPKNSETIEFDAYYDCFTALDEGQVQAIMISDICAMSYAA